MATNLQTFDGATLEAALARVAAECGPRARITQAEKVRTGGVAGFFAREHFELLVDVGGPMAAVDVELPDLTAQAAPAAPAERAEPLSLLELADQVSDRERSVSPTATHAAMPAPSTEGASFQEVLRGIAAQAGLLDHRAEEAEEEAARHAFFGAVAPKPAPATPWFLATDPEPEAAYAPEPRPECEPAPEPITVTLPGPSDAELFASLGIPTDLVDCPGADASVGQRLLAVLERVPSAPPVIAQRGDVLAVIGEGEAALEAAGVLAGQAGQTADDVVVYGRDPRAGHTPEDAAASEARVKMWNRRGVPYVVAICAPRGPAGAAWARDMAERLAPVTIWGAVGADRKPEDIVRWAIEVGGVDALAVSGCDTTATPAAVLATGIPVAAVEGRRATPAAWTALLIERLAV